MVKPDEIPDEVWERARDTFAELWSRYAVSGDHEFQIVVAISIAIMRDRDERDGHA